MARMAESVHAYVRGNTGKFYEWLNAGQGDTLPTGPPIWICGDCHIGNLGPVANAEGQVEIEIRDLDQTVIGNPAHDLVRLGLSLAAAARGSDLPGVITARMLEEMVDGYAAGFSRHGASRKKAEEVKPVAIVLRQALKRKWRNLAQERIEDVKPTIPLGKCFWALSDTEKKEIGRVCQTGDVRKMVTSLGARDSKDELSVLDAAYWMKGCSSLGRLRYAVLVQAAKGKHGEHSLCLLDIKEAGKPAAPRQTDAPMPRDNARRIATGACALSPFLGERMVASHFLEKQVVIRELLPQDLKIEMDSITRDDAVAAARFLAEVVGKAHARQMDAQTRKGWLGELARQRTKSLDAPSWLWTSVVDLIASHETAYLEHCRKYATETQPRRRTATTKT
jgi:uncharacterized protein (DUF2252 family)